MLADNLFEHRLFKLNSCFIILKRASSHHLYCSQTWNSLGELIYSVVRFLKHIDLNPYLKGIGNTYFVVFETTLGLFQGHSLSGYLFTLLLAY